MLQVQTNAKVVHLIRLNIKNLVFASGPWHLADNSQVWRVEWIDIMY